MEVTNEELVLKAKQGDSEAYELLFKRNSGFCYEVAKRYTNVDDLDELAAVARLGMLKAYNTFDLDKGIKFLTYAGRCMTNEIFMHNRKIARHKDVRYMEDVVASDDKGNETTLHDYLESDEGIPDSVCDDMVLMLVRQCVDALSDRDRMIIEDLYFKNKTQREVANSLGTTQSYISRLEKKILGKLRVLMCKQGIYEVV